jgi:hypothetical protein
MKEGPNSDLAALSAFWKSVAKAIPYILIGSALSGILITLVVWPFATFKEDVVTHALGVVRQGVVLTSVSFLSLVLFRWLGIGFGSPPNSHTAPRLVALALAVGVLGQCGEMKRRNSPFHPQIDAYGRLLLNARAVQHATLALDRRLAGTKIVVVEYGQLGSRVHPFTKKLPDALRARTPEDVGLVMEMSSRKEELGEYYSKTSVGLGGTAGAPSRTHAKAYQSNIYITLVAVPSGTLVYRGKVCGEATPPLTLTNDVPGWDGKPPSDSQVVQHLTTILASLSKSDE